GSSVSSGQATPTGASTSSATPGGSSSAAGPRGQAEIMPCTDLSPADVTAMGLDSATKVADNISGQVHNHGCRWKNADFIVGFLATDGTVAMYNNPQKFANVRLLTVAGLPAVSNQAHDSTDVGGADSGGCYVVADIPGGGALGVAVSRRARAADPHADPCVAAVRFMGLAAPILLKR
ncbi:MAG: DUF3558 domain-containing protein, partial [Mycobacteriaceae bacterium]